MQKYFYDRMTDGTYCVIGYQGDEEEVTVPARGFNDSAPVTIIYDKTFIEHKEIKAIHFPDTLTDIGEFAFDGCNQLRTLILPQGFCSAWPNAFARCGIENIVFPSSVKSLAPYVFRDCKNLKTVKFESDKLKINGCAFHGCTALEKIIVPENVEIAQNAFEKCEHDVEIQYY